MLDVNVVLDLMLDRPPFAAPAAALWALAESKAIEAVIPAHGVTTVFYVAARRRDAAFARRVVGHLLAVPEIAAVDRAVLARAVTLGWRDFEDAVCAAAAEAAGCDTIVTRDPKGYAGSPLPVLDPATCAELIAGGGAGAVSERSKTRSFRSTTARRPGRRGRSSRSRRT